MPRMIEPLTLMLQILAEPATTREQSRRRGERAINIGKSVPPRRAHGQCIHKIRLDRNCEGCKRQTCYHGVGMYASCPHCAAESDFRGDPPYARYKAIGVVYPVKKPEVYTMTTGQVLTTAAKNGEIQVRKVLIDGLDVTDRVLAVDEEKGEVLLHVEGSDPIVRRGSVRVIREESK